MENHTIKSYKDVELMLKVVKINQTAKNLYKDEWPKKVDEWTPIINACQKKNKCGVLEAAIILCGEAEDNQVAVMNILAVSVDIMESAGENI